MTTKDEIQILCPCGQVATKTVIRYSLALKDLCDKCYKEYIEKENKGN